MSVWKSEFDARRSEIDAYFAYVERLANSSDMIDDSLLKTLKAAGFLLLYNLIEASMKNGIAAIFDELTTRRVSFDVVRTELKKIAFRNHDRISQDSFCEAVGNLSIEYLTAGFDVDDLFSGNLDARRIRETAKEYGFSSSTDAAKTKNGANLLKVKTNRNDLGHGAKSFSEVGREYDIEELLSIKNEVLEYLAGILANIHAYVQNQEYLAPPAEYDASPHS